MRAAISKKQDSTTATSSEHTDFWHSSTDRSSNDVRFTQKKISLLAPLSLSQRPKDLLNGQKTDRKTLHLTLSYKPLTQLYTTNLPPKHTQKQALTLSYADPYGKLEPESLHKSSHYPWISQPGAPLALKEVDPFSSRAGA